MSFVSRTVLLSVSAETITEQYCKSCEKELFRSFRDEEKRRLVKSFYTEEMRELLCSPADLDSSHITQRGIGVSSLFLVSVIIPGVVVQLVSRLAQS